MPGGGREEKQEKERRQEREGKQEKERKEGRGGKEGRERTEGREERGEERRDSQDMDPAASLMTVLKNHMPS